MDAAVDPVAPVTMMGPGRWGGTSSSGGRRRQRCDRREEAHKQRGDVAFEFRHTRAAEGTGVTALIDVAQVTCNLRPVSSHNCGVTLLTVVWNPTHGRRSPARGRVTAIRGEELGQRGLALPRVRRRLVRLDRARSIALREIRPAPISARR